MKIDVNNNHALVESSKNNAKVQQTSLTPKDIEDKLKLNKLPSKLLDTIIDKHFEEHRSEKKTYKMEFYGENKDLVLTVKNKLTNEVLLELPSKQLIDLVSVFMDMNGIFVDEML